MDPANWKLECVQPSLPIPHAFHSRHHFLGFLLPERDHLPVPKYFHDTHHDHPESLQMVDPSSHPGNSIRKSSTSVNSSGMHGQRLLFFLPLQSQTHHCLHKVDPLQKTKHRGLGLEYFVANNDSGMLRLSCMTSQPA